MTASFALQSSGACDCFEFFLQLMNFAINDAAIAFNLSLSRPAHESAAASLAFKMRPRAHQTAALIAQCGEFHLNRPFPCAGTRAKNL